MKSVERKPVKKKSFLFFVNVKYN